MQLFIVTGISGSGKTTVAKELIARGEVAFDSKLNPGLFHFEDADSQIPVTNHPNDPDWKDRHKWVISQTKLAELITENSPSDRAYVCGGGDSVKAMWPNASKVFLLTIDEATMLARLDDPKRDNQFGENQATKDLLVRRREKFQANSLTDGAIPIDAGQSVTQVVNTILELSE